MPKPRCVTTTSPSCAAWTSPTTCRPRPGLRLDARGRRQPDHHPGRGLLHLRWRRERAARRHGRPVVRPGGLRPRGAGQGGLRPDAGAALLQHLLQDRRAADRACWRPRSPSCWAAISHHVFFNSSGSEAIDTVIRLARHYWQVKGEPERTVIIARVNGYHGSTIAGVSLGGMKAMHDQGGPWVPGIEHVMQPYASARASARTRRRSRARAAAAPSRTRILEVGPRERRRLHRRAGAGRRRGDHPAGRLLAAGRGDLPQVRRSCWSATR